MFRIVRLVFTPWTTSRIAPFCDSSLSWLCLYGFRPLQMFVCMWSTPQGQLVRCLKFWRRLQETPLGAFLFQVVWWIVSVFEFECVCVFLGWWSVYLEVLHTPCFSCMCLCTTECRNVAVLEGCGSVCCDVFYNERVDRNNIFGTVHGFFWCETFIETEICFKFLLK